MEETRSRSLARLALLLVLGAGRGHAETPPALVALLEGGQLAGFRADRPGEARPITPSGVRGKLIGIDTRPADGRLYGLTAGSDLYGIDPATGTCELVSTLTVPFDGGLSSGIDFTPQADRLRLVSAEGRNLRVNAGLGATAVDAPLAFERADPNAGRRPRVTASAYANNVAGAGTTRLFHIDAGLDLLVVQEPPNDGTLHTVGPLGIDFGPLGGFDIVTDAAGTDHAYAASGKTLYAIDLTTGAASVRGAIAAAAANVVSLAAVPGPLAP
jgi:hypothetical protein